MTIIIITTERVVHGWKKNDRHHRPTAKEMYIYILLWIHTTHRRYAAALIINARPRDINMRNPRPGLSLC